MHHDTLSVAYFWQWVYLSFSVAATVFVKLSNISLLMRLQRRTTSRQMKILYAAGGISVLMGSLFIGLEWAQCTPVSDAWTTDPTESSHCAGASSWLGIGGAQGSKSNSSKTV